MRSPSFSRLLTMIATALVVASGCGEGKLPTYPAKGRVTYPDGTPLSGGRVEFQAKSGEQQVSVRGEIGADGSFELGTFERDDGAPAGDYRVIVIPPLPDIDIDQLKSWRDYPEAIDPRFKRYETSGLEFTVHTDADKNDFPIQVQRPRR